MDVRALAERHRDGVTALLSDLVRTPSLSAEEEAVIARLAQEMRDLGYDEVIVDPIGSVIGRIGSGPIRVVYDSHVDTVGVGSRSEWQRDPFGARIEDGVMYGRGASDDKGGIASMVRGGAAAKEAGLPPELTLYVVGSVQEEDCDGLALEHLLTTTIPRPDLVVLGEATNLDVYRGHRGRVEALVRTRGSSCHASAPERGVNPTYALAPIMTAIGRLNGELGARPAAFLGAGSIAVTKIECETPNLNAVPSTATLYVDRRITEGETMEEVLAEIRDLPEVKAAGGEVELLTYERVAYTGNTFGQDKYYPAWATDPSHPALAAGLDAGEDALGRRPKIGKWVFSTNGVASMGKLGIPTIGFGPSNEIYAHTVADQCPIDDLVAAIAWYASFPQRYIAELTQRGLRASGSLD